MPRTPSSTPAPGALPENSARDIGSRLEVLDFLRGFAIVTIILLHFARNLHPSPFFLKAIAWGGAGVHVFIFASGFGLYLSHLRQPLPWPEFLKRRFLRVYVPYALCVPVWAGFWAIRSRPVSANVVASHLLLYKMFDGALDTSLSYPYWFVSTIFQFYLCWPLLVRLAEWRHGLVAALLASLAWALAIGCLDLGQSRAWNSCGLQYLWEFVLGMRLARTYDRSPSEFPAPGRKRLLATAAACLALTAALGWSGGRPCLYNDLFSFAGYLSCALLLHQSSPFPLRRFFAFVSLFGYEWYLLEGLVLASVRLAFPPGRTADFAAVAVALPLSFALALAFSRFNAVLRRGKSKRGPSTECFHPIEHAVPLAPDPR